MTVERYLADLERWYAEIEHRFEVESPDNGELRHLCDARQNRDLPIHSWYNLKEAYSAAFPTWVVDYLAHAYAFHPTMVLDPFIGGGTTAISLAQRGIHVVGVEYNPFIAWAAGVKLSWPVYDPEEIARLIDSLVFDVPKGARVTWPELTTFRQTKYFRRRDMQVLLHMLAQIESASVSPATKRFLRLGVASTIEEISNLRKDGRALRYVQKNRRPTVRAALMAQWQRTLDDLKRALERPKGFPSDASHVWRGSAVDLCRLSDALEESGNAPDLSDAAFDLVLYSPPYLNNFDYSEVYKLELWLLGFVKSYDTWKVLRRGALRSHHSVTFPETSYLAAEPAAAELVSRLAEMVNSDCLEGYAKKNMPRVIAGYFDDMYLALKEQFRVLRPGGMLVYMVANSRHSDLPVATDLLIGEIAQLIGFIPLKLITLHKRNGRTRRKRFLRESVVILRKP